MKYYINLYFAQSLGIKYNGGLDYAYNLLFQLQKSREVFNITILTLKKEFIDEVILRDKRFEVKKVISQDEINNILSKNKKFLFFEPMPYNLENFIKLHKNGEFYIVIHGLRDIELPNSIERVKYGNFFKEIIKFFFIKKFKQKLIHKYNKLVSLNNVNVITVSYYSKASIELFLKNAKVITKIYPPVQKTLNITSFTNILDEIGVTSKKYIVMTGSERWSKNTKYMVKVISELFNNKGFEIDILVLGAVKKRQEIHRTFKVVYYNYLDDSDFEQIMENAFIFVYPSLNEGFGYPPVYAMKLGTPVLASSMSSIVEVLSSGAIYVSPLEKNDILIKVNSLILNDDYRKQLILQGNQRYQEVERMQNEDMKLIVKLFLDSK